jgi:L-threonylcarbamoyladenylate synthase
MFKNEIPIITSFLKQGKTILYPTDTIWGIGCDAKHKEAVNQIFEIKKRNPEQKFIILVNSIAMLEEYTEKLSDELVHRLEGFVRPTTIIYPKGKNLAVNALSSDGSVAIRIPKDDFCQQLITDFGGPIISTSANYHGEESPCCFKSINKALINAVDYVVNYKQEDPATSGASQIFKLNLNNDFIQLR